MIRPPTSRSLLNRTWALLIANAALLFTVMIWRDGAKFMPSQLGILMGFIYGVLCGFYHVHTIHIARRRIADLDGPDRDTVRKRIESSWLVGATVQLGFGMLGFTKGIGSLYTAEFGSRAEVTYIVFDVAWRSGRSNCYKYKFDHVSWVQNILGAPCLDIEYPPGARFHYRGQSSWVGFKEDAVEVESDQPPRHRKVRR
jgi:hypothetical protein